jgi:hypothetical protein
MIFLLVSCQDAKKISPPPCEAGFHLEEEICITDTCGFERFPEVEADFYVDPTSGGGIGSKDDPFATIGEALAADLEQTTIALAAGVYLETLEFDKFGGELSLIGRCPELVTIQGESPQLFLHGKTITLQGTTFSGRGLLLNQSEFFLNHLVLSQISGIGLTMQSATVTGQQIQIADIFEDPEYGSGYGVQAASSTIFLSDTIIERATTIGGYIGRNSEATLERVSVLQTSDQGGANLRIDDSSLNLIDSTIADGEGGGIYTKDSSLFIEETSIIGGNDYGIATSNTFLTMSGGSIENTLTDEQNGIGILADEGTDTLLQGVVFLNNQHTALRTEGASATIENITVEGTWELSETPYALVFTLESDFYLSNIQLMDNMGVGIATVDSDGILNDVTIQNMLPHGEYQVANGLYIGENSNITLENATIEEFTGVGIVLSEEDAYMEATALTISDITAPDVAYGVGILVLNGGWLVLKNSSLSEITGIGIASWFDSVVQAENVQISLLHPASYGNTGIALYAGDDSSLYCTSCTLEDAWEAAVFADVDSKVGLDFSEIHNTRRSGSTSAAVGVLSVTGSSINAGGLEVSETEGPGIWVTDGGTFTCSQCLLHDNLFAGAAVEDGTLWLQECSIENNGEEGEEGGVGVFASDTTGSTELIVHLSTIGPHYRDGIYVSGAGSYKIHDSLISGSEPIQEIEPAWSHGNSIMAVRTLESGLIIEDTSLFDANGAGIFLDMGAATIRDPVFSENALDLSLQGCNEEQPDYGISNALICPPYDSPYREIEFNLSVEAIEVADPD